MSEMPSGGAFPEWTLHDRLRKALDYADVSVADMADELDVNRNTVGNYLAGRTRIPKAAQRVWALRCGVNFVWLSEGKGAATPPPPMHEPAPRKRRREISLPRLDSNQEPAGCGVGVSDESHHSFAA